MQRSSRQAAASVTAVMTMAALVLLTPPPVRAMGPGSTEGSGTLALGGHQLEVSGRLGVGWLSGESTETVYDTGTGRKLSELVWDLDSVFLLNAGASIEPTPWLRLNADVWFRLNDGSGSMDDYDYVLPGYGFTHWSHSEVDLSEGYIVDVNAAFAFHRRGDTVFSALAGYRRDAWEWDAKGGSYVYSVDRLYDTVGTFPDGVTSITYEQWYDVPYLGLGFTSRLAQLRVSGRVLYSPFVSANDKDTHHFRDLVFEQDLDSTTMFALDFAIGYDLTSALALQARFQYQQYDEAQGSTTITDRATGAQYFYGGDAAGTEHESGLLSLGLQYTF